jgi:hypothetical protein
MHVKTTNGNVDTYPYSVGQLRRDNPNTSFPKRIPDEMLAEWGVYPVEYKPHPDYDDRTQRIEHNAQPVMEDGQWFMGWSVMDKTAEEVQEHDDNAAQSARSQRDHLLVSTDWLVIKAQETGVAMGQVWLNYRQALRDITDHVNFPYLADEDWPVKPD